MTRVAIRFTGLLTLCGVLAGSAPAADEGANLFILSGQSNMAGLNPAASFTPAVEKAFGAENVLVVKDALGAQPIRRWFKNWKPAKGEGPEATGDLYDRLMEEVKAATAGKRPKTVTFVWMQGERDAKEGHGDVYAASLKGLIEQLQADLGRQDINFVIGRLSDFGNEGKGYPDWMKVREAQAKVAEDAPRGAWVDTDDLNGPGNGLHYTQEGYVELGSRFAGKAIELIRKN